MKKTKRLLSLVLCTVFLVVCCTVGASAVSTDTGRVVISESTEYLEDGSYIVTTISVDAVQTYSYTTSGSKTSTWYNSSDVPMWSLEVYGTFEYQPGSYSYASSASRYVSLYSNKCSLSSSEAYCQNNSAIARATVYYGSVPSTMYVNLSCDTNGRLS